MSDDRYIGKRVTLRASNMGAMSKTTTRMVDRTFSTGDELTCVLRMPDMDRHTDWYALEPDDDPTIYVPAHVTMFEVVA